MTATIAPANLPDWDTECDAARIVEYVTGAVGGDRQEIGRQAGILRRAASLLEAHADGGGRGEQADS